MESIPSSASLQRLASPARSKLHPNSVSNHQKKMNAPQSTKVLSDPTLLEKIDRLRELNIGQHVPLPQLVVVGDQSSGKSSLLESLTGIPFPKGQTLCTRHATQITSRRDNTEFVDVRIIPGLHASEEHRKHLESFREKASSGSQFQRKFVDIMKKAKERMGLSDELSSAGDGAIFSEDVLKVQVCGPRVDYLTIIDVPGIFRTTTEGTTKDDMVLVRDLVKRYIKDERTIILAVLPSNADVATQEIIELAGDYDKEGKRTLGVLTKPDLVLEPEAQAAVCDLIQGQRRPLRLGYHLVRNRGAGGGSEEQTELDQLFLRQPWCDLPQDRVGIPALREKLRELLVGITRHEFPKLRQDVSIQITECKRDLNSLGPPRQDERDQRRFLSHIARNFQDHSRAALAADYTMDPIFDQHNLRLITHVVNITHVFSTDFQHGAHSRYFHCSQSSTEDELFANRDDEQPQLGPMMDKLRGLLQKASVDDVEPDEFDELHDVIVLSHETPAPYENVTTWINEVYLQSRGLDLGTFSANFVAMAFAEQSRKWGDMTQIYMSRVIVTLHRFIKAALRSVYPDEEARRQLWSELLDSLVERYKGAIDQAKLLIEVEQRKQPYTLNRQFAEALSISRGRRITDLLRPKARKDTKQYGELQLMVNLDDISKIAEGKDNVEQLQEEIHDILQAYYSLALDRFIDNVFQLAVDYCLLQGPSSPLKVFTQEWVINLEPEKLERIAGETKSAKKQRSRFAKKLEDLIKAMDILKTY